MLTISYRLSALDSVHYLLVISLTEKPISFVKTIDNRGEWLSVKLVKALCSMFLFTFLALTVQKTQ